MGFESGAIGCRMFYVPGGMPRDAVERFAKHAAPPVNTLGHGAVSGWVTGRHLLDRNITEDTAILAGYLRLTLMKAERKVPEALLRAECRMQELSEMQAEGKEFLPRSRRSEIRREILERLQPTMPPTLTGIPMVHDPQSGLVYAGAMAEKQMDAFVIAFRQAAGKAPILLTPESAALERKQLNARDLKAASFSDELEDELAGTSLGHDFLTWLWFHSEARGGMLDTPHGEFAVAIEGPLTFELEGAGAHVALLRKGTPMVSAEAKTALVAGKKLSRATVQFVQGELAWQVALDARDFVLRGVKLPKGEKLDAISQFQQRMVSLGMLRDTLLAAFDSFLGERFSKSAWPKTRDAMRAWVKGRVGRF